MTRAEQKVNSINKEIEKIAASLKKAEKRLESKTKAAEKVGANWTKAEWFEHRAAGTVNENQYAAYFDLSLVREQIDELNHRKENAESRLAKATGAYETETAKTDRERELNEIGQRWAETLRKTPEEREAEYQKWLAGFKARCEKDGVQIDEAEYHMINGTTKSGKKFSMFINSGATERSLHCYSLNIDGKTIFTSGDFSTGYKIIRR